MLSLVIKIKKICYYQTDNSDNKHFMANPFFSGRIPQELFDKAEECSKQSGKNKTDILIEALSLYLNIPVEVKKTVSDSEELWKAVKELQEKVERLEKGSNKNTVISNDNNDINKENKNKQYSQLSIIESDKEEKTENCQLLETEELLNLPGIKELNSSKITNKIRNAKQQNKLPIKIENYLIDYAGKNPDNPRSNLWKVIVDN